MDRQRLRPLPRLPPAAGQRRRIQRQVHVRPAGAARRQLRHPGRARARQLPQFLPACGALAVLRPAPGQGRLMAMPEPFPAALVDRRPDRATITADVLAGLSARPRTLPSKYFYDARGSVLFECITHQPEYYLTGAELELLQQVLP